MLKTISLAHGKHSDMFIQWARSIVYDFDKEGCHHYFLLLLEMSWITNLRQNPNLGTTAYVTSDKLIHFCYLYFLICKMGMKWLWRLNDYEMYIWNYSKNSWQILISTVTISQLTSPLNHYWLGQWQSLAGFLSVLFLILYLGPLDIHLIIGWRNLDLSS